LSARKCLLAAALLTAPGAAAAQTATEDPFCTDRPAKANATCTVPSGHLQLESSVAGWS
jgi:hypothetical protein